MKKLVMLFVVLFLGVQVGIQSQGPQQEQEPMVYGLSVQGAQELDPWTPMIPPVNALVMAMVERDLNYEQEDPEFFWTALYYMVGIHHVNDFRVTTTDEFLYVPEEMMADCAYALFGSDLMALPVSLADYITEEAEGYRLARGDAALVESVLVAWENLGDGRFLLQGDFRSLVDASVICSFDCEVLENDGMFGYEIETMTLSKGSI